MLAPFAVEKLVTAGLLMYKGAAYGGAFAYAVGSYSVKGGKVVYNLVKGSGPDMKKIDVSEDEVPDRFKCAITGKVMISPVVCPHESYFEKDKLLGILNDTGLCPVHKTALTESQLVDCPWLADEIEEYWMELASEDAETFDIPDVSDYVSTRLS